MSMAVGGCPISRRMFGRIEETHGLDPVKPEHVSRTFLVNIIVSHRAFVPARGAASLSVWVVAVTGCVFTVTGSDFRVLSLDYA